VVEVHDRFAALTLDPALLRVAERREEVAVEREAALHLGDDEVEVVDPVHGRGMLRVRGSGP
jgi:hypothetical protein